MMSPSLLAVLLLSSCDEGAVTQVLVHLDADQISRSRAEQLRVQVFSADGTIPLDKSVKLAGQNPGGSFPFTIPLAPVGGDASRSWGVLAELSSKGTVHSRLRATGGYVEDELREVWLSFEASCWDKLDCAKLESCREGQCVLSCVKPGPEGSRQAPQRCDTAVPASPLGAVAFWASQLDLSQDASAVDKLVQSRFDMLVLEPTRTDPGWASFDSKGMVKRLHATKGRSGKKRLVIAYLAIGVAEDWRYYWKSSWTAPTGSKKGYPDFLAGPESDGAIVAFWDQRWKNIIIHNKDSMLQEALNDGYDGVHLSWVQAYQEPKIVKLAQAQGRNPATEMINFIGEIRSFARKQDPEFLIVTESSPGLAEGHPGLFKVVDAIVQEHIYFDGVGDTAWGDPDACDVRVPDNSRKLLQDKLKRWLNAGFPVFNLEFACDKNNVDESYSLSKKQGYVTYVSRWPLDRLSTMPSGY